nr:M48 family metalloprotease [Pseudonocardia sp. C8]
MREHGAAVEVRANLTRSGRLVRVYPAGLRRARVAVFAPFVKQWRADRAGAEAVLLHEIAHLRTGDHLLLGIGSPFVALLNVWLPLLLLGGVLPWVVFALSDEPTAWVLAGQLPLLVTELPRQLLLPVAALWAAELAADRHTARLGRSDDLIRVLQHGVSTRTGRYQRMLLGMSHPPPGMRRAVLLGGRWGDVALLAGWPLSLILLLVVILVGAVPAWLLIGQAPTLLEQAMTNSGGFLRDSARLWVPAIVLLALWPVLGRAWTAWWSGATTAGVGIPTRLYLAVAATVLVLFGSLVTVTA